FEGLERAGSPRSESSRKGPPDTPAGGSGWTRRFERELFASHSQTGVRAVSPLVPVMHHPRHAKANGTLRVSETAAIPALLKDILASKQVSDENGKTYGLHSEIAAAEGEFIQTLIAENDIQRTLEVGCAFGISSLFICGALSQKRSPRHLIIDPHQSSAPWHGIGVLNLKKAGFSFFELIERPSEIALPELLRRGELYDFALIDGWHTFDHALLDFFYIDRMLKPNGIVVFDDVDYAGPRRVVRYISNFKNYEIIRPENAHGMKHRLREKMVLRMSNLLARLPEKYTRDLFSDNVFRPDFSLGINASMVALRKTAHDERGWDWYAHF
ncbi:MAG: class I SAM-dependent methyltransferase, partial [Candidatus Binatia bacterium]